MFVYRIFLLRGKCISAPHRIVPATTRYHAIQPTWLHPSIASRGSCWTHSCTREPWCTPSTGQASRLEPSSRTTAYRTKQPKSSSAGQTRGLAYGPSGSAPSSWHQKTSAASAKGITSLTNYSSTSVSGTWGPPILTPSSSCIAPLKPRSLSWEV
jgi:hypothetical protein